VARIYCPRVVDFKDMPEILLANQVEDAPRSLGGVSATQIFWAILDETKAADRKSIDTTTAEVETMSTNDEASISPATSAPIAPSRVTASNFSSDLSGLIPLRRRILALRMPSGNPR